MKRFNLFNPFIIISLSIATLSITGCATTKTVAKLEQTTPQIFTLPVNYVDAYANAKDYYQKCIARASVSYPVTVNSNGIPITIMSNTPEVRVLGELDRENKLAYLNVYIGADIDQRARLSELDTQTTAVSFYAQKVGLLRSDAHKQKVQDEQVALFKQVSLNRVPKCIK